MKKFFISIMIALSLLLIGCNSSDVPEGMKLASDTSRVYYSLFVPQEWVIDTRSELVTSAHASKYDRTSINVQSKTGVSADEWWTSYKSSLSFTFTDIVYETENEDTVLGGINAKRYVFYVTFGEESKIKYEIITAIRGDMLYSLTLSYTGEVKDGNVVYSDAKNAEDIKKITDNFKFNDTLTEKEDKAYEIKNTPEGMKPASDTDIVDYCLFVPENWVVSRGTGTVSLAYVSEKDKTNVSVMQWNVNSYDYDAWWNDEYINQLYNTFDPKSIVKGEDGKISYSPSDFIKINEVAKDTRLGENDAKMYTYSLKIDGNVYDYRVIALMARASVYVMTFTFKGGADMSLYNADIEKIMTNFRFN